MSSNLYSGHGHAAVLGDLLHRVDDVHPTSLPSTDCSAEAHTATVRWTAAWPSRLDQVIGRSAGGGMTGVGHAQLQQHLRAPLAAPGGPGLAARIGAFSSGWVYRLANTHRLAACSRSRCSAWPSMKPVGPAITAGEKHRRDSGGWPVGRPAARGRGRGRSPVGVAARTGRPGRLGRGRERVRRHAIAGGTARMPGPVQQFSPGPAGHGPACSRPGRRCRPAAGRRGPGSTMSSVARSASASCWSPARSPAGSGSGANAPRCVCRCGNALSISRSLDGHRLCRAHRYPGEQPQLGPGLGAARPLADIRASVSASRSPNRAAPRLNSMSRPIGSARSLRCWWQYSSIADCADPEPPRLGVVHRRRAGRGRDQVVGLIGQDWCRRARDRLVVHSDHLPN